MAALKWTRSHSLTVVLPPNVNMQSVKQKLRDIADVTGCDSTESVLTVGFAHRLSPTWLRRSAYRQARRVLIEYGVINPNDRAQAFA